MAHYMPLGTSTPTTNETRSASSAVAIGGHFVTRMRTVCLVVVLLLSAIYTLPSLFPTVWHNATSPLFGANTSLLLAADEQQQRNATAYKSPIPIIVTRPSSPEAAYPVVLAWTRFINQPMMEKILLQNIEGGYTNKVELTRFRDADCPFRCVYTDNRSEE